MLGVAFMAGTLVLTDTISKTFDGLFTDVYAGTDAVRAGARRQFDAELRRAARHASTRRSSHTIEQVDGVAAAEGHGARATRSSSTSTARPIGDPGQGAPTFGDELDRRSTELNPYRIAEGHAPAGAATRSSIDKSTRPTTADIARRRHRPRC